MMEQGLRSIEAGTMHDGGRTILANAGVTIACLLVALFLGLISAMAGSYFFTAYPSLLAVIVFVLAAPYALFFLLLTLESSRFTMERLTERPRRWL